MQDGLRIAMLISGGGSTAEAIIRACSEGRLRDVVPALLIASKPDIGGIQKAIALGIRTEDIVVIERKAFATPEEFGEAILRECRQRGVNFIGQYGWLPKTPANVVEAYEGMMINQHPGPLDPGRPDFGGKGMFGKAVHAARLNYLRAAGWPEIHTEVVAQRVHAEFDLGAVVESKRVVIEERNWTPEQLQSKALVNEHLVQLSALQAFAHGTVKEIVRETPLIPPENIPILEQAKADAIKAYPKG